MKLPILRCGRLDKQFFRILQYEDFVEHPDRYEWPLSSFLELPIEDIRQGLRNVRKNPEKWRTALKKDEIDYLVNFFDESRKSLWPIFYDPLYRLVE
jgi:hypothetical protein